MSTELVMPSNHLILCCLLFLLPSNFPSLGVFTSESVLRIRWPKYWSFNFSISPSNEYSALISFGTDCFFFSLQSKGLSRVFSAPLFKSISSLVLHLLYGPTLTTLTTGKTITLTIWTFVRNIISLLFNRLSRLVKAFLLRSKCLLISWLQSPSAVILEPPKIVCHCFLFFPKYLPWSDRTGCHDLSFLNVVL